MQKKIKDIFFSVLFVGLVSSPLIFEDWSKYDIITTVIFVSSLMLIFLDTNKIVNTILIFISTCIAIKYDNSYISFCFPIIFALFMFNIVIKDKSKTNIVLSIVLGLLGLVINIRNMFDQYRLLLYTDKYSNPIFILFVVLELLFVVISLTCVIKNRKNYDQNDLKILIATIIYFYVFETENLLYYTTYFDRRTIFLIAFYIYSLCFINKLKQKEELNQT